MSWHKIDVEGRRMWESSDGERVADPNMIYSSSPRSSQRELSIHSGLGGLLIIVFLLGLILGIIIGSKSNDQNLKNPDKIDSVVVGEK